MDVSYLLWDLVFIVSHQHPDTLKENRIYQTFESASFLNRSFCVDECRLISSALVTYYPKGVMYDHVDAVYHFVNIQTLFYGAIEMLKTSHDIDNNLDAQDKLERLETAVKVIECHSILDDLTNFMSQIHLK